MRTIALVILIHGLVFVANAAFAQDVQWADVFAVPNRHRSLGGFFGGDGNSQSGLNDWIDWSIGNSRPLSGEITDDMVFSTNVGDFFKAGDWLERMRIAKNGNVGIGLNTSTPSQRLHIGDGNILLEGGGETALLFKRDVTFPISADPPGPSGPSPKPIFQLGRIQAAGDGDPELRVLYEDDDIRRACPTGRECARSVLKVDRKGIVASVKFVADPVRDRGSHFEAFLEQIIDGVPKGDPEPLFRLNSAPSMQLEMGPGGERLTDVIIRRETENTMTVLTGNALTETVERLRIGPNGLQVVRNYLQVTTIAGGAPPTSDCNTVGHMGRLIVRTDGPPDLYVCLGPRGWLGK